jgi:hypothetical protein
MKSKRLEAEATTDASKTAAARTESRRAFAIFSHQIGPYFGGTEKLFCDGS